MLILLLLPSWSIASSPGEISSSPGEISSSPGGIASSPGGDASPRRHLLVKARCLDKQIQYIPLLQSWGIEPSPGGDAYPRRHLLGKARCLDKQIQYIFSLPSWGIDPQLDNTDAGTRRPQVRTRLPPPKKQMHKKSLSQQIC